MKRIISLLLVICLLVPAYTAVLADDAVPVSAESSSAPVAATDNMLALASIGVLNEADLTNAAANVKRGNFARISVKFANAPEITAESYTDLDETAAVYATSAVTFGLMDNGVTGNFRADNTITGADVQKAVVTSLGYADIAKFFGDYNMAAKKLNILKGISLTDAVTYAELADYLVDVLRTERTYTVITNGNIEIKKTGVSYIEDVFDCRIVSAKVTATAQTSLDGSKGLGDGLVKLGNERFFTTTDFSEYIGCTAEFIVKDADHKSTVIYTFADSISEKESLVINAEDISEFSANSYTYYEKNKKKKVAVAPSRTVVYNGQVITNYTTKTFVPENGYVRLVDGNADGKYDIVFIYSYRVVVSAKPDVDNKMLADKFGEGSVTWTDSTLMNITRDGKPSSVDALKKGDVLIVYQSTDGNSLKIDAWSKNVKGVVESFDASEGTIIIGNTEYEIEPDYFSAHTDKYTYTEGGVTYKNNVLIGKNVVAYVTAAGTLAYMEYAASTQEIGYLIDAKVFTQSALNPTLGLKMFTTNGKIESLETADQKIVVDNERVSLEKAYEMLKKGGSEVLSQLVSYTLNAEGKVTEIDTPYNNAPLSIDSTPLVQRHSGSAETDGSFRITYSSYLGTDNSELLCKDSSGLTFGRRVAVLAKEESTVAFSIPADPKNANENAFGYYSDPTNYYKSDSFYKLEAYQFSDSDFIANVLVTIDNSGSSASTALTQYNVGVVLKITTIEGDNGEAKKIELYESQVTSGSTFIYATEDKFWKTVKPNNNSINKTYELGVGDIIRYDLNTAKEITNIRIFYDASESDPDKAFVGGARADMPRENGDMYTYPRINMYDVYEMKGKTCKVTTENLHRFDGDPTTLDYYYEDLSIYGDTIIHIDKTGPKIDIGMQGNYQGSITIDDVKDYVTYGKNCSRVIGVTKWGFSVILIIIDDVGDVQ